MGRGRDSPSPRYKTEKSCFEIDPSPSKTLPKEKRVYFDGHCKTKVNIGPQHYQPPKYLAGKHATFFPSTASAYALPLKENFA